MFNSPTKLNMRPASIALAVALIGVCSFANAQSAMTRDQVNAELQAARRSGDWVIPGELGLTERQVHPDRYLHPFATPKTTDEVRQELALAMSHGDMPVGDLGLSARELRPDLYPRERVATKSREQVKAEWPKRAAAATWRPPARSGSPTAS